MLKELNHESVISSSLSLSGLTYLMLGALSPRCLLLAKKNGKTYHAADKIIIFLDCFRRPGLFGHRRCIPKADVFVGAVRDEGVAVGGEGEKICFDGIRANGEDLGFCFSVP